MDALHEKMEANYKTGKSIKRLFFLIFNVGTAFCCDIITFGCAVIHKNIFFSNFFYFLISFYLYPLYVSAPMCHRHVEYTTSQSL
jgi:hypothetical protein